MMNVLVVFALTIATLQASRTDATAFVQYADGRITVDGRDAALADVLGEIIRATLEMRGTPTVQRLSIRLGSPTASCESYDGHLPHKEEPALRTTGTSTHRSALRQGILELVKQSS